MSAQPSPPWSWARCENAAALRTPPMLHQSPANKHCLESIRPLVVLLQAPDPPPRESLHPLPLPGSRFASGPESRRAPIAGLAWKPDRAAPLPRALREPCTVFRRPTANENTAASRGRVPTPAHAVPGNTARPLCKPSSSRTDRSHRTRQHAVQEIRALTWKCFRPLSALRWARKWHSRCLQSNTTAAAFSRMPRSAIPRTRLRSSPHHRLTHTQSRRFRGEHIRQGELSLLEQAPSTALGNTA